ncbi:MAG: AMP-binding protein, partial [Polaromonas sp.]
MATPVSRSAQSATDGWEGYCLFSASLGEELRRAAAEAPDQPFIRMLAGEWSYRQVDDETDCLAGGFTEQGVGRRDNVTLLLPNCIEFAVSWFALSRLGAVAAPVNTSFRGAVLANAINLVRSRLVVVHACLLPQLQEVLPALSCIEKIVVVGQMPLSPTAGVRAVLPYEALRKPGWPGSGRAPDIGFSELSLLLYTSGTTGRS